MNKTEQAFATRLELLQRSGLIAWWAFEPFKLRLAPQTTYSPDFAVLDNDGLMTLYEIKGFFEEDARVKTKVAADRFFMFAFVLVRKRAGGFVEEPIGDHDGTGRIGQASLV